MRFALLCFLALTLQAEHIVMHSKVMQRDVGFDVTLPAGYDKSIDSYALVYRLKGALSAQLDSILVQPEQGAQRWLDAELRPYIEAHYRTLGRENTHPSSAESFEYKPGLLLHMVKPTDWNARDRRAAVVWIHGGGWTSGEASRFLPQARYYAVKGAVGFTLQYRLAKSDRSVAVEECMRDVQDAMRYLRAHAAELGINPKRSKAVVGSYDAGNKVLTLVQFTQPKAARDYVNSLWKIQKDPYGGDAANSYNDGAPSPGAKPLGPFYELESSSPAAALAPGRSLEHVHRTIHLSGPEPILNEVARATLGVSLEQIQKALSKH